MAEASIRDLCTANRGAASGGGSGQDGPWAGRLPARFESLSLVLPFFLDLVRSLSEHIRLHECEGGASIRVNLARQSLFFDATTSY